MSMSVDPGIFRAYDIRGVVGERLNPDTARAIGRAYGAEARELEVTRVVVGRDGRLSSPELESALIEGLLASGLRVIRLGCLPTPVTYYAALREADGNGIMVTGSHNPPAYNGFKLMLAGRTLHQETVQRLRRRIDEGRLPVAPGGTLETAEVCSRYLNELCADIHLDRPLRVAVDCGNGAAAVVAPEIFRRLGCEVVPLYCEVDGHFPHHHPDPSRPENLEDLRRAVESGGLDLGLAFDGDGDRLGVVDGRGRIQWPDRLMMCFAADVLAHHPGSTVVFDVKCSHHLAERVRALGGVPDMWRTGHSLLKARMEETGALLAGEMSGHVFFRDRWLGVDDAIYAGARLLESLARDSRSPARIFDELPQGCHTPELLVTPGGEEGHGAFMARFLSEPDPEGGRVNRIDGLRVDFDDGWGLVRASNTTPCLTLRFEGSCPEALARIQTLFRERLLAVDPELELPF
ncbi:phosphomannomutase/phosphoglucomutase [Ectothiorhodospira shaposhnikovii]|uniref:phosphomannomutase/phosphoglucomutase n=1 Tax=Ectothiorhodospira shaposhnikovii TaxID=1054 RepID=UPI001EE84D1E|nr:phosphomannomutase/phosphoglucomutase [Ectothiorhodospira shaposhnikovii]MCG5513236.1 phosphomannomutase/phosphoglucomutase [Ectothiorhodospira shaposhnikovii]